MLAADSYFRHIDRPIFDDRQMQDLLTLRSDRLQGLNLLVGDDVAGKAMVIRALVSKAAASEIPYVVIRFGQVQSNIPYFRDTPTEQFFTAPNRIDISKIRGRLPQDTLCILDPSMTTLYSSVSQGKPFRQDEFNGETMLHLLEVLRVGAGPFGSLAILNLDFVALRDLGYLIPQKILGYPAIFMRAPEGMASENLAHRTVPD